MFTGIITDVGTVRTVENSGAGKRLTVVAGDDTEMMALGASIACNGVCLTVVEAGAGWFSADISRETMSVTTSGDWREGDRINLEQPLRLGDELGGHIVLGHVDDVGRLENIVTEGDNRRLTITLVNSARKLAPFLAMKGSVTLDGVSLTVNSVTDAGADQPSFDVNIIPHTLAHTNLGSIYQGAAVNIEIDMMARYAARLRAFE